MGDRNKCKKNNEATGQENRLVKLAEDILDGKVFTSRHLWVISQYKEQNYLNLMATVFSAQCVAAKLQELKDLMVKDLFDGVIFYQYLDKSKIPSENNTDTLPLFHEIEFIYGQDVKTLDEHLQSMYKNRLN